MRPANIRRTGLALAIGAALWSITECMEILWGAPSTTTMFITGVSFSLMLFGIWALHAGHAARTGKLSLVGAICISITYFIFSVGSFSTITSVVTYEALAAANWIFAGFFFMALGAPLMGLAILRGRVYPFWTGIVLVLSALIGNIVLLIGLPTVLMNLANLTIGLAYITIGRLLFLGRTDSFTGSDAAIRQNSRR